MSNSEIAPKLMGALRDTNNVIKNMHISNEQNFAEWRILKIIGHHEYIHHEGIKITEIAVMLHVSKPTVSQKIFELEQQGYILRETHTKDRRVQLLTLTEKGHAIAKQNFEAIKNNCDKAVVMLGEENAIKLYELLEQFIICLNEAGTAKEKS